MIVDTVSIIYHITPCFPQWNGVSYCTMRFILSQYRKGDSGAYLLAKLRYTIFSANLNNSVISICTIITKSRSVRSSLNLDIEYRTKVFNSDQLILQWTVLSSVQIITWPKTEIIALSRCLFAFIYRIIVSFCGYVRKMEHGIVSYFTWVTLIWYKCVCETIHRNISF